jgi:hypothetical protein
MKKILITLGFIVLQIVPAQADGCPAGAVCEVDFNITTKVTTYKVIPVTPVITTPKIEPVITPATHILSVQTANQGLGVFGTPEQIAATVNEMVAKVTAPIEIDTCANNSCNKMEVNATTQEVTVSAFTKQEIQQKAQSKIVNSAKDAELAKIASQALPNIQTIELAEKTTPLDEIEPEWWELWLLEFAKYTFWFYTFNWQL